ncbi:MAG: hypothetical protein ACRDAM_06930, partial [Casimicrobium sp.]
GLAVNPVTEKIYVANNGASNVTIINPATVTQSTHSITVSSPSGAFTSTPNPTLALNVSNAYSPNEQAVRVAHARVGTRDGAHAAASGSGPFNAALSGLQIGINYVSLFAIDALEGSSGNGSAYLAGTTTLIGTPKIHAIAYTPLCDFGTYSATGSVPCTPASAGSFVPTVGATAQLLCPSGTTSSAGASTCTGPVLNVDGSDDATKYDAATDGVLVMRYLAGFRGASLIANAIGTNATRNTALLVETHLSNNRVLFDVDGDGVMLPMTDGLMILRRLLNPNPINMMTVAEQSAITANAKRGTLTDAQVLLRIEAMKP